MTREAWGVQRVLGGGSTASGAYGEGLGFRVSGFEFRVFGLGFLGLGFREAWGLGGEIFGASDVKDGRAKA